MYAILTNFQIVYGPNEHIIRAICKRKYPNNGILAIKKLINF